MQAKFWLGKLKKRLGRPRIRMEDNIKMDMIQIGCEVVKRIRITQN